ncbi:MAG TPA: beta-ketoacyl-[acyl-carrier-protein] synthase family protein [Pyrinomonadaceae bacterium]|nr:beta-ketoacyl-[acyl-carrier-protein] synthase family protein [Pyrinomonadaceae bacterium]
MRRVVVTGIGMITPLGSGCDRVWSDLCAGKSGISKIEEFDTSELKSTSAGICRDFQPLELFDEREVLRLDRTSQLAVAATTLAANDSQLTPVQLDSPDTGVILGTGYGGIESTEEGYAAYYGQGKRSAITVPKAMSNAAASNVAMRFKSRGPNMTVSTACSSGANAIGQAFHLIRHGVIERMITGGVDAPITPVVMYHWQSLRVLSTVNEQPARACKPFSANRDGFVMAEGTGIVILETLESARERGAHIYGEIIGYASTADAQHITLPDPDGESQAMIRALRDGNVSTDDIHYINAHGTATKFNDSSETKAIKQVFGDRAYEIPVSSIKAMLGHSMGASGALEFIASVLAVERNLIPPTINYEEPDPECDLDYVTEGSRPIGAATTPRIAMSNSFGFGGNNAVLVVRQYAD